MRAVSFLRVGIAAAVSCGAAACGNGDDTSSPPPPRRRPMREPMPPRAWTRRAPGRTRASEGASGAGCDAAEGSVPIPRCCAWPTGRPTRPRSISAWRRHGTGAFEGPILAANAASIDDAGASTPARVRSLSPRRPRICCSTRRQYDARIVAAGSVNCSTGIADATNLPALASGGLETLALVGAADPQHGEPRLQLVGFVDELKNSRQDALLIRVINADADLPKVEVGMFNVLLHADPVRESPSGLRAPATRWPTRTGTSRSSPS